MRKGVIIGIVVLVVVIITGILFFTHSKTLESTQSSGLEFGSSGHENEVTDSSNMPVPGNNVDEMIIEGESENCGDILTLETPVNLDLVTSILYPGQVRGGDYKPHGGFRFDNSDNKIFVRIPIDSYIIRGSRYIESGQVQYLIEFKNDCGVSYRFDHLLVLSEKLQTIADTLPEAKEGDSRTINLKSVEFSVGEEIATEVGIPGNVFVDFGVYDLRKKNKASETSELIKQYPSDLASHAVCWLDWLSPEDSAIVKSLPGADGQSGKESEYC